MLGWRRDAMTCASCWKRVTKFGSACRLACSSLIATWRCNCVSSAFQTSAMPPCPRRSCNSYFPSRRTGSVLIAISSFYYCCRDKGRCGADVGALCLSVPACLLDPQGDKHKAPAHPLRRPLSLRLLLLDLAGVACLLDPQGGQAQGPAHPLCRPLSLRLKSLDGARVACCTCPDIKRCQLLEGIMDMYYTRRPLTLLVDLADKSRVRQRGYGVQQLATIVA